MLSHCSNSDYSTKNQTQSLLSAHKTHVTHSLLKNHWSDGHPSFPDTLPGVVPAIQRGNPQGINIHKIAQSQVCYVVVFDAFGLASDTHWLSSPCAKIFAGIRSLGLPYFGAEIGSVNDLWRKLNGISVSLIAVAMRRVGLQLQ